MNDTPSPDDGAPVKVRKAERTRQRILDTSLRLFREVGYEATTMRRIATEAEVSLGNAYYYFRSKDHLIQEYYGQAHREHLVACRSLLEEETDLRARLAGVLHAKIATSEPYHRFAGQLFRTAADPTSPLSPFSPESAPVRTEATELMARIVDESETRVPKVLRPELPNLLWLYLMGIILFWIHDASEGAERTHRLIERTVDIVVRLISLARLPVLRPLVQTAVSLTQELRQLAAPALPEASS